MFCLFPIKNLLLENLALFIYSVTTPKVKTVGRFIRNNNPTDVAHGVQ